MVNMLKKLYKYCAVNDYTIENLERNQLYFNYAKNLNDPYEGAFDFEIKTQTLTYELLKVFYEHRYEELIESGESLNILLDHTRFSMMTQFLHEMRLTCFSSSNNSLLMWGHYANRHHGICIEYGTNDPIFFAVDKVRYTNEIPKFKINTLKDIKHENLTQQFINSMSTKEIHWNYEDEFRLFDITGTGIYKLMPGSISSIYMGLFCSMEDEKRIRKALFNQSVRYYRTKLNTTKYKVEFYEV
jgi:hypothetical protein